MNYSAGSGGRGFVDVLEGVQMSKNEMGLYVLLSRRPMTIKQIIKRTRLSERMIRTYLDDLIAKNFVGKRYDVTKNFKYVYYGNPEESIADILIKKIREFDRKSLEAKRRFKRNFQV
jgi:predicted transcriptional regulator